MHKAKSVVVRRPRPAARGRPAPELPGFRGAMSSMFEDFLGQRERTDELFPGFIWEPAVDVEETDKEYIFEAELPGLGKEDLRIEIQNGTLSISGERKDRREEKGKDCVRHEQRYGMFRRVFTLPADARNEGVKAAYKNGILTVTVPRSEAARPKPVDIDFC